MYRYVNICIILETYDGMRWCEKTSRVLGLVLVIHLRALLPWLPVSLDHSYPYPHYHPPSGYWIARFTCRCTDGLTIR